jgi:probable F420-dependent oxidoreductase
MKASVCVPLLPFATADYLRRLGEETERLGFHCLWVGDHLVLFDDYESWYPCAEDGKMPGAAADNVELDPFTSLAYIAAFTEHLRLAVGVCVLPQRNPVYTAKQAANVDLVSGGRFTFGVGVGWLAEEFTAANAPFDDRGRRTDAYLDVCATLWADDVSAHSSEFYELPPCRFFPKPVQSPGPPIYIGGNSRASLRRAGQRGDGWYALSLSPDEVAQATVTLTDELARHGRTRSDVSVAVCPYPSDVDPATVEAYRHAGVDELVALVVPESIDDITTVLTNTLAAFATASDTSG